MNKQGPFTAPTKRIEVKLFNQSHASLLYKVVGL